MNERNGKPEGRRPEEPRAGATRALSALLGPLTRRALGKHGFSSASLISDWPTIIGADLAASCQPVKLAFPPGKRDSGTLHLQVSSGAALEIQHVAPQIIDRINSYLGYGAVARLKLVQGPLPRPPAARRARPAAPPPPQAGEPQHWDGLDDVEDPSLRESLERLGTAIAEREARAKK